MGVASGLPGDRASASSSAAKAAGRTSVSGTPIPHWLGEVSYALYLTHFLLWKAARLALPSDIAPPWFAALYIAGTLALAHLLYHRFERPAQRWVERRLAPRPERTRRARIAG